MKRWAQNYDQCQHCGRDWSPHKARGLCSRCYAKKYKADELVGTLRHWYSDEADSEADTEWKNDQAYQQELTAAWILWLESPALSAVGWGLTTA